MRNEILAYLLIGLGVFVTITIPGFLHNQPDLSQPNNIDTTTTTQTTNTVTTQPPPNPGSGGSSPLTQLPNLLRIVILVIVVIVLILLISQFRTIRQSTFKREGKEKKEKEQVRQLSRTRDTALEILRNSLITGDYTSSFIEAYVELDHKLEYFRDIARPKHFTPREYSFSVRQPIFQPNVYRFVKIFYRLRYGNQEADRQDIETFIDALEHLFEDEVPQILRNELWMGFKHEMDMYKEFHIPRQFDLTKPKGGKL